MPKSTHLPEIAGGVAIVTGTLVIETGLREIQTAVVSFKADALTANEEATAIANWAGSKLTIKTYKGGTASGTIGAAAVQVAWYALGK